MYLNLKFTLPISIFFKFGVNTSHMVRADSHWHWVPSTYGVLRGNVLRGMPSHLVIQASLKIQITLGLYGKFPLLGTRGFGGGSGRLEPLPRMDLGCTHHISPDL